MRKVGDRCRKFSFGKSNHINSNMNKQPKQAFTLIELLTVIAIIGILASILIPTVGRVRESARRTVDASNIRQIGQASLIYANDNREALPPRNLDNNTGLAGSGTTDLAGVTVALALSGGLNDTAMWISQSDKALTAVNNSTTVLNSPTETTRQIHADWRTFINAANGGASFSYVTGLRTAFPSTTPVAVTRGVMTSGTPTKWQSTGNQAVYGADGGHIVFLGGNVTFFKDLGSGTTSGRLIKRSDSTRTSNILQAIGDGTTLVSKGGSYTPSQNGTN